MFTTWDQLEAWIKDNQLVHWVFTNTNPAESGGAKENNIIADSNWYKGDEADKLEMTRKYITGRGRVYGVGFRTPNATTGGVVCEARIEQTVITGVGVTAQPMAGAYDEAAIEKRVEARIRAEIAKADYERREADLAKREKEFAEQQQSAIGALTKIFGPIGQAWMQNHMMRNVAGVDAAAPVVAPPVQPIVADPNAAPENAAEVVEENPLLTPEDEDKWYRLIERFVKIEPRALELMESVVTMAESGDATYNMAKGFLIK